MSLQYNDLINYASENYIPFKEDNGMFGVNAVEVKTASYKPIKGTSGNNARIGITGESRPVLLYGLYCRDIGQYDIRNQDYMYGEREFKARIGIKSVSASDNREFVRKFNQDTMFGSESKNTFAGIIHKDMFTLEDRMIDSTNHHVKFFNKLEGRTIEKVSEYGGVRLHKSFLAGCEDYPTDANHVYALDMVSIIELNKPILIDFNAELFIESDEIMNNQGELVAVYRYWDTPTTSQW